MVFSGFCVPGNLIVLALRLYSPNNPVPLLLTEIIYDHLKNMIVQC